MLPFDPLSHGSLFRPEYGSAQLSDHLPMAAFALRRLGANNDRIERFAEDYRPKLEAMHGAAGRLLPESRDDFGTRRRYDVFLAGFSQAIDSEGRARILQRYVPMLLPGIGTAAFHGLIRTAYGVDADNDREIAAGLAYWADTYGAVEIDRKNTHARDADAPEMQLKYAAERFSALDIPAPDGDSIFAQMASLLREDGVRNLLATCRAGDRHDLQSIAAAALTVFFATDADFVALHCVTGTHAARLLAPFAPDEVALRRELWAAILLAYFTRGKVDPERLEVSRPDTAPTDWVALRAQARASDDAHDIKFVYSCQAEDKAYRDSRYKEAAALQLG